MLLFEEEFFKFEDDENNKNENEKLNDNIFDDVNNNIDDNDNENNNYEDPFGLDKDIKFLSELFEAEKKLNKKIKDKSEGIPVWDSLTDGNPKNIKKFYNFIEAGITDPNKIKEVLEIFGSLENFLGKLLLVTTSPNSLIQAYNNNEITIYQIKTRIINKLGTH